MKRKYGKRATRKVMIITVVIPIILCLVIILCLCMDYFKFSSYVNTSTAVSNETIEYFFNMQSLVFTLIGVAISVWIGLNIYNALSKEELRDLLDQAERASEITERVYTEVLKSKFRMSLLNTESRYLADRLEIIERLPSEILEKLFQLEDLFDLSYRLYDRVFSGPYIEEGQKIASDLISTIENDYKRRLLNKGQHTFLMGYISLRMGDFLYFQAKHSDMNAKGLDKIAMKAIRHYEKSAEIFFGISNLGRCSNSHDFDSSEKEYVAYLANNIGSAYLLFISPGSVDLDYVISLEQVAFNFSNEMSPLVREVFVRNLGVACERNGKMNEAIQHYNEAFQLNHGSWKAAHCIGSWYRKMALRDFPEIFGEQKLTAQQLRQKSDEEKANIEQLLKKAIYWYRIKQLNNNGLAEMNLSILNFGLYKLTKSKKYRVRALRYKEEEEYSKSIIG